MLDWASNLEKPRGLGASYPRHSAQWLLDGGLIPMKFRGSLTKMTHEGVWTDLGRPIGHLRSRLNHGISEAVHIAVHRITILRHRYNFIPSHPIHPIGYQRLTRNPPKRYPPSNPSHTTRNRWHAILLLPSVLTPAASPSRHGGAPPTCGNCVHYALIRPSKGSYSMLAPIGNGWPHTYRWSKPRRCRPHDEADLRRMRSPASNSRRAEAYLHGPSTRMVSPWSGEHNRPPTGRPAAIQGGVNGGGSLPLCGRNSGGGGGFLGRDERRARFGNPGFYGRWGWAVNGQRIPRIPRASGHQGHGCCGGEDRADNADSTGPRGSESLARRREGAGMWARLHSDSGRRVGAAKNRAAREENTNGPNRWSAAQLLCFPFFKFLFPVFFYP